MRRFFRRGAGTEAEAGLGRGAAPGFRAIGLPAGMRRLLGRAVCHNEQSASLLSSLELSHVLQYAPSFSLSAPCILLTLTRRLRVISNAYFDTPSGFCVYLTFGEYRMRFGNVNQTSLLPLRSPFAIFAKCKDSW